jgi:PAS domain-containing protein
MPGEERIRERVRNGERIEQLETVRVRKDGARIDVSMSVSPIRDAAGHLIGSSKIVREITEQKRLHDALQKSETRFRQLADSMPDIVWAARPDGCLDYYNRRWYEFTGLAINSAATRVGRR